MLWGKRNEADLPAELRGLTPEQLVEKLKAAETATAKVSELEGKLSEKDTELSTVKSSVSDLSTKIQALEANNRQEPVNTNTNTVVERTSFLTDEDKAFNERFNDGIGPVAAVAINAAKITAKMSYRQSLESQSRTDPMKRAELALFNKYEGEVDAMMDKQNPTQAIHTQAWDSVFNYVKGQHAGELMKAVKDGSVDYFSEPVSGSNFRSTAPDDTDKLTPEEEATARKFGLTPEAYLKSKKGMVIAGA